MPNSHIAQSVLEAIFDPAIIVDLTGKVLLANKAALSLSDINFKSGVTKCHSLLHCYDKPCAEHNIICPRKEILATQKPIQVMQLTKDTKGRNRLFKIQASPIFDDNQNIIQFVEIIKDVTKVQQATKFGLNKKQQESNLIKPTTDQKSLLESESRFSSLVANLPGVIYRCALDEYWTMHFISDSVEELTGRPKEDFIGNKNLKYVDVIHPDDQDMVNNIILEAIHHNKPFSIDYRIIHTSGEIKWVHERGLGAKISPEGETVWLDGAIFDVTSSKKAERVIKNTRERLSQIVNFLPDATWVIDINGKIEAWNLALERMTGYLAKDMLGKGDYEYSMAFYGERRPSLIDLALKWNPEIAASYLSIKKAGGTLFAEGFYPNMGKDGKYLSGSAHLLYDATGEITGAIESVRDITDHVTLERNLKKAKEKAELATQAKNDFLANMSHEIRTPMNAVIGMTHLALDTELNDTQKEYLEQIQSSAGSLLRIIDDILDFSKIEAGKLVMEEMPFSLEEMLNNAATIVGGKAREKKLEFLLDLKSDVPINLIGDPLRLNQIIVNLCNNAVKFTDSGEIVLTASLKETKDPKVLLEFKVRDTGMGMTRQETEKLFQAFTQGDPSITRKFGGTGLGLTISKSLVQSMGGQISVKSTPKKGSEFTFTANFVKASSVEVTKTESSFDMRWLKVLVVDDNPSARDIFKGILESFTIETKMVSSGQEALEELRKSNQNKPYDLAIIDWQMPHMNGFEAIEAIKKDPKIKHIPKIIMVTAYNYNEVKKQSQEYKLDGFMVKPISPSSLLNTIAKAFEKPTLDLKNQYDLSSTKPIETKKIQGNKILLVEDNRINQKVAMGLLHNMGLQVDLAENGMEALEKVFKNKYDAILMDVQMPVLDGYQATKKIRKIKKLKNIPIIAMTAHAMAGDRQKSLAVGMDDHITKPIDPDILAGTLLKWISISETKDEILLTKGNVKDTQHDFLPGISKKQAMRSVGDDIGMYEELLDMFLEGNISTLSDIKKSLEQGAINKAAMLSHALKGTASTMGAYKVQKAASDLETSLKNDSDFKEPLNSLETNLNIVLEGIKEHKKKI